MKVVCTVCGYSFDVPANRINYSVGSKCFFVTCQNPSFNCLYDDDGSIIKKFYCNTFIDLTSQIGDNVANPTLARDSLDQQE